MSAELRASVEEYLELRHAMGYRLHAHGRLLPAFVDYLTARHAEAITVEHALAWACLPQGTHPRWHATRLAAVRALAAHVHARDPQRAELIPTRLLPVHVHRVVPHLYTGEQIAALLEAAHQLRPAVRAHTMVAVISLMTAVGLRIGEALGLDTTDLDLQASTITVTGKYAKKRRLPVHPGTISALTEYLGVSRHLVGAPVDDALFVTCNATRPKANNVQSAFRSLTRTCGLLPAPGTRAPRLHDLRHTFAVNTLLDAHRDGINVDTRIAALATYLGHVNPMSTYWYLSASPDLLNLVNDRVQAAGEGRLR